MRTELQGQVFSAIYACLRPLAKFLLRTGVTYKQFADLAKLAFVEEAYLDIGATGRRSGSDSRVASKTGISRKEIKRIRELRSDRPDNSGWLGEETYAAPSRVLQLWNFDPAYLDEFGEPRELEFDVGAPSFTSLVKSCAGDIPPGAIRAELLQAGAIEEGREGRIKALKKFYVPGTLDEKTVSTLSVILFPVASGIAHNLRSDRPRQGYIQRFAYSDSLSDESRAEFRVWARERAGAFVEGVDQWLSANERSERADLAGASTKRPGLHAGMGVFYYEGPSIAEVLRSEDLNLRGQSDASR
jgi:hypothetical protein